ncbi:MAG: DUF72 domain-containing protein [Endomicrobia bacterium]|nr:DUF72 domain-containing protein [Endomicrobiia bacterium]
MKQTLRKQIKVGCCGFPIQQQKYYKEFSCVEINSTFYQIPSIKIATRWKTEAEKQNITFEFVIKSWQIITHKCTSFTYRRLKEKIGNKQNYGFFMPTEEVFIAWEATKEFAVVLGCKKILFQCPSSFTPLEGNLKNLYNFFKKIEKDKQKYKFEFIIEVRGEQWNKNIVTKVAKDLDLLHCVDPLYTQPYYGDYRYYRLHGLHIGNRLNYNYTFSDEELKKVYMLCDKKLNYVMFNNSTMYDDALRFIQIIS